MYIRKVYGFSKKPYTFFSEVYMKKFVIKLVFASLCLALCIVLPMFTGNIPEIGKMLSPMHIPVLLCGFICGGPWGMAVGLIAPFLKFLITSTPAVYPTAVCMAFELMAYGFFSGLFYRLFPKKVGHIYLSLILAMLLGRCVWGLAMWVLLSFSGDSFTLGAFWAGAFAKALPGIVCHIIIVPLLVMALKKAGLIRD